jgi:hypothetical protein
LQADRLCGAIVVDDGCLVGVEALQADHFFVAAVVYDGCLEGVAALQADRLCGAAVVDDGCLVGVEALQADQLYLVAVVHDGCLAGVEALQVDCLCGAAVVDDGCLVGVEALQADHFFVAAVVHNGCLKLMGRLRGVKSPSDSCFITSVKLIVCAGLQFWSLLDQNSLWITLFELQSGASKSRFVLLLFRFVLNPESFKSEFLRGFEGFSQRCLL